MILAIIPTGTVSAYSFDSSTIVDIKRVPLPATVYPPPWRMRLAYGRNYTVQNGSLAGSITAARLAFVGAANRIASAVAVPNTLTGSPRPTDPDPIGADGGSTETTATATQVVINNMVKLWGTTRRLFEVTVPAGVGLDLDWCSIVTVISEFDGLTSPGKQGQIVGWRYASGDSTATFRVLI